jgi:NAD+ diphosphatase
MSAHARKSRFTRVDMPHLQVAEPAHNRLGEHRHDQGLLDQLWRQPTSFCLQFRGNEFVLREGRPLWQRSKTVSRDSGEPVLLGERDGQLWWALLTPALGNAVVDEARQAPGSKDTWTTLRALILTGLDTTSVVMPLLFHAAGLAEWRLVTRFCPSCSGNLKPEAAGHELRCDDCGRVQFPRSDPAVIMAITSGEPDSDEEQILLARHPLWPEGRYSTLAGFCEPGEALEHAVRREVFEEVGIEVGEVHYFGNQAWPMPASLMLGFRGRALTTELHLDTNEIAEARWFTRAELKSLTDAGTVKPPTGLSISRSLIESWCGTALTGAW